MNKTMREANDIIYRMLFGKDTRALLIHFNLSADHYNDDEDNAVCDCMGTLALQAVGEAHRACVVWLQCQPMNGVTSHAMKKATREIVYEVAKSYKAFARANGADLLSSMLMMRKQEDNGGSP